MTHLVILFMGVDELDGESESQAWHNALVEECDSTL
jgi:hypothetical protein